MKAASSAEHMKVLAVESSSADSHFQHLDKLRMVFEEYVKLSNETIPKAEKELHQLNEELDEKSQALDDVIGISPFMFCLFFFFFFFFFFLFVFFFHSGRSQK